jgi:GT2 family glycosyltransferase
MEHYYDKIQGWFSFPNLYTEMVKRFDNANFLEIGCWKGKSTSFLAVEIINSHKEITLYCLDTWEGSIEHKNMDCIEANSLFEEFEENLKPAERIKKTIKGNSLFIANSFPDNYFDFIFLDASHEYQDVKKDLQSWYPKVKNGGVFVGHDYQLHWQGVVRAVDEFAIEHGFNIRKQEDCWVIEKVSEYKSALIIPCFIKTQWDLVCLNRLLKSINIQTKPFDKVYVIDDLSPLNYTLDFSFVEHIRLSENGGPAKARNIGIEKALSENIQYLLFTDHDCILDEQWNEKITSFLHNTDFGAVGGMTYSFGRTLFDYYHNINGTLNGKWLLPDRKELWYMPSLNFGMKSYVANQFSFDERFPTAAGEDVDLCLRLRSKYKIGFCPKAKLWHDFGYKSTVTGFKRFVRIFKKYKSSSATLYEGHTVLLWDSSESIYSGNAYEFNI